MSDLHLAEIKIGDSDNILNNLKKYLTGEQKEGVQLHQSENKIYTSMLELGRRVLQEYVNGLTPENNNKLITNSQGNVLPYKKTAVKEYLSIFGPIEIQRPYYWKEGCVSGIHPLDGQLNLPEGKFSYALQDMTLSLLASCPYQEALDTVEKFFKIRLWPKAVQTMVFRASIYVDRFYKEVKNYDKPECPVIAVAMDCKGIPMVPAERSEINGQKQAKVRREKGDKRKGLRRDAVVTTHFTFSPSPRTPQDLLKALMKQHTVEEKQEYKRQKKERKGNGEIEPREPINKQVHAAMDGKISAFERLADQIYRRNTSEDKKIIVLIDGASSLENRFREEMQKRKWTNRVDAYILDIFHASEYLWSAGTALYGEKNPERQKWVTEKLLAILEGKIGRVVGALRQILKKDKRRLNGGQNKTLETTITYFENHKHMMRYNDYLNKGYPVGTGVVEGACGCLVKDRTDRSGMKWSSEGAQAILNLRAVKQNKDWDKYFAYYVEMERKRLYENEVPGFVI